MGLGKLVQRIAGKGQPVEQEIVGTLLSDPVLVRDGDVRAGEFSFHLDSAPDLEFRQERTFLTPDRKKGERIKVHYRLNHGVARVSWVEKA